MDDHNAISRIKQGDLNGLEILVNQYQARAVHAAYLVLYDRGLAEDVVQTAFVKVAERIHQYDNERPFAPWFFRIVVNESLKVSKKQNRQVSLDRKVDEPTLQLANWLAESDPNPELLVDISIPVTIRIAYPIPAKAADRGERISRCILLTILLS